MALQDQGYVFFEPGHPLVELIILSGDARENWIEPTDEDIQLACRRYDLNYNRLRSMIEKKNPNVHTVVIDADVFRRQHIDIPQILERTGLEESTICDLLAKGWTFRESIDAPPRWVSPQANLRSN